MLRLQITDNSKWKSIVGCSQDKDRLSEQEVAEAMSDIEQIADVEIGKLKLNDNPNLLVFPSNLNQYGDEISKSHILSLNGDEISTGNIMGFVGVNNTQLDIKSRFAKNSEHDYFLHYMLQKVFSVNLFDIQHTISRQPIFDFLLYLFPHFLKKALIQGLFKKYRRFEYNDTNVRGPIDVNRHIRENIPFRGTVAYSTREHSYDNEITQLVRHTIEYIRTKEQGSAILNNDSETKGYVSQVIMATQTYNARERSKVINQNLRPVRHPYFSAYADLQKICLQILRHESIKYGQEKNKVYGILFDGAWLWEEYLNTIFEENNLAITHAKNKIGENGISLYKGGAKCYYPDFYRVVNDSAGNTFVLDAKYKRLNNSKNIDECTGLNVISICHDDLFQMITYMHVLQAQHCALLYPLETEESEPNYVCKSKSRYLNGYGGEIHGYGIKISTSKEKKSFWKEMKDAELDLCNRLNHICEKL